MARTHRHFGVESIDASVGLFARRRVDSTYVLLGLSTRDAGKKYTVLQREEICLIVLQERWSLSRENRFETAVKHAFASQEKGDKRITRK